MVLIGVERERKRSYSSKVGTKSTSPMVRHFKIGSQQEVMTSNKCQYSVVWRKVVVSPRSHWMNAQSPQEKELHHLLSFFTHSKTPSQAWPKCHRSEQQEHPRIGPTEFDDLMRIYAKNDEKQCFLHVLGEDPKKSQIKNELRLGWT